MRGAGLSSQEEGVGRPLQTQLQRPVLTGSGLGQAGKAGAPQQRLGQGLRPGLCSWSSCSGDLACMSSASWGPRASITEWPCLEQRCLGMVGLSWGGGAQLGGPGRDGGRDPGPESCMCCSEAGGVRRKEFACSPPRLSESKAPPLGTCSLVL